MLSFIQQISENIHQNIFVSYYRFAMFGSWIMTSISYVTVQYYYGKKLDENGNPCYVASNIWIVVANIFIRQIYTSHPMGVVVHNPHNIDMILTLFSSEFSHVDLFILIHYWNPPKAF